ncbi:hypothetical protein CBS101457_000030 [Exobasidium rhododendri]|nr:hypothetical protein CBS101457_000030 [Exobasidium rhododendri]
MLRSLAAAALLLFTWAALVSAHNHHHPRAHQSLVKQIKRDGPQGSTESSAAALLDPTQECSPYGLDAISAIVDDFPSVWTTAEILAKDTRALNFMKEINASGIIPSGIPRRGDGSYAAMYQGVGLDTNYNTAKDASCYWTATGCTTPKHTGLLPDVVKCLEPHTWGYTLDDGPNCSHNALYDFWLEQKQKATLFYIGSNVLDWPLEAQRGIADGHHICVHTWSHPYMTSLTDDQAFAEMYYALLAIKVVTGVTPTCFRPPFGDTDDRIRAIAQALGLRTIIWSDDTNDFDYISASTKSAVVANYAAIQAKGSKKAASRGGIIVLQHELTNRTMGLVKSEYAASKAAWKYMVPLTACLNLTQPYPEAITYPNFAQYISGSVSPKGNPSGTISISSPTVTPQGTLSGMGGHMPTGAAGGTKK